MKRLAFLLILNVCILQNIIGQDLYKNLLIYYPFDGDALDLSGNNFHGAPVLVKSADDHFGQKNEAYHFNGSAYIDLPYHNSLQPELPISIAFWFKLDNYDSELVALFDSDFSNNNYYGIYCSITKNSRKIGVGIGDGGRIGPSSRRSKVGTTTIEVNIWYHVAILYKGPLEMDIFINACPDEGIYGGFGGLDVAYQGNHGTLGRIDANATPGPIYHLEGSMDEFYMWDRIITKEEIQELYGSKQCGFMDCSISIPKAFTPNDDNVNDYFKVIVPEDCNIKSSLIRIYSRWGEMVFQGTFEQSWDGMFKGEEALDDVYIYYTNYNYLTPIGLQNISSKGNVTLIR